MGYHINLQIRPGGHNYDELMFRITNRFKEYRSGGAVRIVGLLFGRPNTKAMKEVILPDIKYWHYRSGEHVDFFCIGFGAVIGGYSFFVEDFSETVRQFEEKCQWRYSGETELLLLNAWFDADSEKAELDFSTVVSLKLEQALEKKVIESIPAFFEQIIRHAETYEGDNPTWALSDSLGGKLVLRQFLQSVLSLLPAKLGEGLEKLFQFYTKDLSTE